MSEEYILATVNSYGEIGISATGPLSVSLAEIDRMRDELISKRLLEPNIQAILRKRDE